MHPRNIICVFFKINDCKLQGRTYMCTTHKWNKEYWKNIFIQCDTIAQCHAYYPYTRMSRCKIIYRTKDEDVIIPTAITVMHGLIGKRISRICDYFERIVTHDIRQTVSFINISSKQNYKFEMTNFQFSQAFFLSPEYHARCECPKIKLIIRVYATGLSSRVA